MSKDKGSKNTKKAPAEKSSAKAESSYKSEGKTKDSTIQIFTPKSDSKSPSRDKKK
jgi:hypothetical protein